MNPENNIEKIIDHVPSSEELQQSSESVDVFEAPEFQTIGLPEQPQQKLLQGPRQTGSFELPNGNAVVAEVTGDGMKQTRTVSNRASAPLFKSAKEFYESKGMSIGTAPEQDVKPSGRFKRFAKFVIEKAKNPQ